MWLRPGISRVEWPGGGGDIRCSSGLARVTGALHSRMAWELARNETSAYEAG